MHDPSDGSACRRDVSLPPSSAISSRWQIFIVLPPSSPLHCALAGPCADLQLARPSARLAGPSLRTSQPLAVRLTQARPLPPVAEVGPVQCRVSSPLPARRTKSVACPSLGLQTSLRSPPPPPSAFCINLVPQIKVPECSAVLRWPFRGNVISGRFRRPFATQSHWRPGHSLPFEGATHLLTGQAGTGPGLRRGRVSSWPV